MSSTRRCSAAARAGCGTGLWKFGDVDVIDGFFVNGTARVVGWTSSNRPALPVRLHLPLCIHDDHRRVRAADPVVRPRLIRREAQQQESMSSGLPLLSLAIWLPIVAGRRGHGDRLGSQRADCALAGAHRRRARVPGHAAAVRAVRRPRPMACSSRRWPSWIARFHINYHLGIDGVSLLLILLNSFTTVLVVIAGWQVIETRVSQYMAAFLFLSGIMNGVFCALDGALFYVFFEATLIPMFIIIGVWGGTEPRLRRGQVLPLHAARLAADAGRVHLPLQRRRRQLLAARLVQAQARHDPAGAGIPGASCWPSP